jgi:hypothetical protein
MRREVKMESLLLTVLGGMAVLWLTVTPAQASEVITGVYITGRVTLLEPTYMPQRFQLQMDDGASLCPAGTWLVWEKPSPDLVKAVYATALTALLYENHITFEIKPNDNTCRGQSFKIGR